MSLSASFTAVGASAQQLVVPDGEQFSYDVSGTFIATVVLQQQVKGDWQTIASKTAAASDTLTADGHGKMARFRWLCSAFTSGTAVCVITQVTSEVTSARRAPDGTLLEETTADGLVQYSPSSISAKLTTPKGAVCAIERTFTETAGAGVYTGSVSVPAGATLLDIIINGVAVWNPATSARLKVGDTDDDGFYTGVDLMATDLLAGESLSFALAGGKAGAYIANSQVSPRYSATARTINGIITVVGGSGSTGRTRMTVVYHLPVTADIVAATKV
jgi:hypothetical protein